MTRAYCTRCGAERDAIAGRCPEGHAVAVDRPGYVGRHRARVAVPRLQVLEVLGFSDHAGTVTAFEPAAPRHRQARIPSTPRRSTRPAGRHRYGTPSPPPRTSLPALTLATVDTEPTENTGVLVERLWEASSDTLSGVEAWQGAPVAAAAEPSHRWWPWLLAGVSILAAIAAIWILPQAANSRRAADSATIAAAVDAATVDLGAAREAAAVILDPAADAAVLSGMAGDLAGIDTAARTLLDQAVAAEAVELEGADAIGQAGELALSLERRLSTVLTYRLLIESALVLPELPSAVTPEDLGEVARSLAESITSVRSDVESLPRDELLDIHRADTMAVVSALEGDQAAYLAALRDGDAEAAGVVAGRMRDAITGVHTGLAELLDEFQPWIDDTIAAIGANLPG